MPAIILKSGNVRTGYGKETIMNKPIPRRSLKPINFFTKEDSRYSHRVSIEEIEENDFNVNISRYVSTAVSAETIDLNAVHAQLVDIEIKVTEAVAKHNTFPKELGLSTI